VRKKDKEEGSLVNKLDDDDPLSKLVENGESFYLKVNSRPIFSKGANWIPADSFSTRISKDKLVDLLESAIDANMNCIRIWGGGTFESEDFYQICNELGLLIWHDLMFACSTYEGIFVFSFYLAV
jgi:beta-mannosidase